MVDSTDIEAQILAILKDKDGLICYENSILILSRLINKISEVGFSVNPEVSQSEIVDILPEQLKDIEEIKKEPPAIDIGEFELAEKLTNESHKALEDGIKTAKYKTKSKKISIEEFKDVRRLDEDELF